MTANPHLIPILDHWLTLKKPGFAIMVTAPWGAGKSFAVKDWLKGKQYVYVSLFGLDSAKAIEEALFQAALERDSGNTSGKPAQLLSKAADKFAQLAGGAIEKATNVTVDLSGLYRASVLSFLPDLIIFDDLERAQVPAPQLLAVLNHFVEHRRKSVLLIANEAELEAAPARSNETAIDTKAPKSDYRRWREKVVGRTITLTPETDAALTAFLDALPEGKGKTLLAAQRPLIRDVFDLSKTDNLRLLRQSLTDLCRFLDRLPDTYRNQTKVLPGLIGDFLALSIAWHAGDRLEEADFSFHARALQAARRTQNGKSSDPIGLHILQAQYRGSSHIHLDGRFLPGTLAQELIVRGHVSEEDIGSLMRQADAFAQKIEQPWRRLYFWERTPEGEVHSAIDAINADLKAWAITEPTKILHVFAIQIDLANHGLFDLTPAKVVEEAKAYIEALAEHGRLQSYQPESLGSTWMTHDHSHNQGYAAIDSVEVKAIRSCLRDSILRIDRSLRSKRLAELLEDLEHDPARYRSALMGTGDRRLNVPDLTRVSVFLDADPDKVADKVFSLTPDRWSIFLAPFKYRIAEQENGLAGAADESPSERDWLIIFRNAALSFSKDGSPLKRQQIRFALAELSFLDTPPPTKP